MRSFAAASFIALVAMSAHVSAHEEEAVAATVHMTPAGFEPSDISIVQGGTVVFENLDTRERWPASDIHPTHGIYSEFDPDGGVPPGGTWSFTFDRAGTWTMHDHLVPEFTGVVRVAADPDRPAEDAGTEESGIARAFAAARYALVRAFYSVFPSRLDRALEGERFMESAHDAPTVEKWLRIAGPKKVMERVLAESGNGAERDCHTAAHEIGRVAYKIYGAGAFKDGDMSCHSGFYHGAMERFIAERGTDDFAATVDEICSAFDTRFGIFECLHGVGHGVLAYKSYDLPAAIEACSELGDDFERRSCYGGAFMENIVTGLGIGADPSHTTQWLSDDPHFPCNAIGGDFGVVDECYGMQTSWMGKILNYDMRSVALNCMNAPAEHRDTCFNSFGRDVAGNLLRDPGGIVDLCSTVPEPEKHLPLCIRGATNVIIDFWGDRYDGQAQAVCDLLEGEGKARCESNIRQRLTDDFGKGE